VAKWEGDSLVWKEEQEIGGAKIAYSETFREIRPASFLQELQEGESLRNLHTTAMITATAVKCKSKNSETSVNDTGLRAAMARRQQAMIDGDEDVVDRLTAKEYAQTDIFGHVQDKAAWMSEYFRPLAALIKDGKFRWERYEERDLRLTVLGDTGVVTGELAMRGIGAKFTEGKAGRGSAHERRRNSAVHSCVDKPRRIMATCGSSQCCADGNSKQARQTVAAAVRRAPGCGQRVRQELLWFDDA